MMRCLEKKMKLLRLFSSLLVTPLILWGVVSYPVGATEHPAQLVPSQDTAETNGTSGDEDLEQSEETTITPASITPDTMLHFVMRVRWGNVEGEVTNKDETNFDGSVALTNTGTGGGHVSLMQTEQFETHNATADTVTSRKDPVSWTSLIYGHWDGVRVLVSAPASATVTTTTTQGNVVKTVEELFKASEPVVVDVGDGREIVLKIHPFPHRHFFLKVLWGKVDRDTEATDKKYNFSGSLEVLQGAKLKLIKTIRFENAFRCLKPLPLDQESVRTCARQLDRDRILNHSKSKIEWQSLIYGDVDGILVRVNTDKDVRLVNTVTVKFPEFGYEKSYSMLDLFHNRVTKDSISVEGGEGYGVMLEVWRKPDRSLLRAKGKPDVFVIEDGEKEKVPSPNAFWKHGFKWEDVEEVSDEELATYADGGTLPYPDGTLLQGSGPGVFVVAEGKKRHFVSPRAFEGKGYRWGLINRVPDSELNLHETGTPVTESDTLPEGTLFRIEGTPTVWKIENGKRRPVPGLAVFYAHKFDWQNVLVVDPVEQDTFAAGDPLIYPDGSLLSGPDGKVYQIDDSKKRWIRSALDFMKAGYDWEDIITVAPQDLARHEYGSDVKGDDVE